MSHARKPSGSGEHADKEAKTLGALLSGGVESWEEREKAVLEERAAEMPGAWDPESFQSPDAPSNRKTPGGGDAAKNEETEEETSGDDTDRGEKAKEQPSTPQKPPEQPATPETGSRVRSRSSKPGQRENREQNSSVRAKSVTRSSSKKAVFGSAVETGRGLPNRPQHSSGGAQRATSSETKARPVKTLPVTQVRYTRKGLAVAQAKEQAGLKHLEDLVAMLRKELVTANERLVETEKERYEHQVNANRLQIELEGLRRKFQSEEDQRISLEKRVEQLRGDLDTAEAAKRAADLERNRIEAEYKDREQRVGTTNKTLEHDITDLTNHLETMTDNVESQKRAHRKRLQEIEKANAAEKEALEVKLSELRQELDFVNQEKAVLEKTHDTKNADYEMKMRSLDLDRREKTTTLEAELITLRAELARRKEEASTRENEYEDTLQTLDSEKTRLESQLETIRTAKSEYEQTTLHEQKAMVEKIGHLNGQISVMEDSRRQMEDVLSQTREQLKQSQSVVQRLEKQLATDNDEKQVLMQQWQDKDTAYQSQIVHLETQLAEAMEDQEHARQTIKGLSREMEELNEQITEFRAREARFNRQHQALEARASQLSSAVESMHEVTKQMKIEAQRQEALFREKDEEWRMQKLNLKTAHAKLDAELESKIQWWHRREEEMNAELATIARNLAKVTANRDDLESLLDTTKERMASLRAEKDSLVRERDQLSDAVDSLQTEENLNSKRIKQLEESIEERKAQLHTVSMERDALAAKSSGNQNEFEESSKRLQASFESTIEQLKASLEAERKAFDTTMEDVREKEAQARADKKQWEKDLRTAKEEHQLQIETSKEREQQMHDQLREAESQLAEAKAAVRAATTKLAREQDNWAQQELLLKSSLQDLTSTQELQKQTASGEEERLRRAHELTLQKLQEAQQAEHRLSTELHSQREKLEQQIFELQKTAFEDQKAARLMEQRQTQEREVLMAEASTLRGLVEQLRTDLAQTDVHADRLIMKKGASRANLAQKDGGANPHAYADPDLPPIVADRSRAGGGACATPVRQCEQNCVVM